MLPKIHSYPDEQPSPYSITVPRLFYQSYPGQACNGNSTFNLGAAPAGKVWKITHIGMMVLGGGGAVTMARSVIGLIGQAAIEQVTNPVSATWYKWTGEIWVPTGGFEILLQAFAPAGTLFNFQYSVFLHEMNA